jgi:uncharacterized membrane protein
VSTALDQRQGPLSAARPPRSGHPASWWLVATITVGAVFTLVLIGLALAWLGIIHPSTYGGAMPEFWPFFPFGFLGLFIFLAIVLRFGWWGWGPGWGVRYESARETLRVRYARGEITRDQLRQMLRDLDEIG